MALKSSLSSTSMGGGKFRITLRVWDGTRGQGKDRKRVVGDRKYKARISWSAAFFKRCGFSPQTRHRGPSFIEWRDRTAPSSQWVELCCKESDTPSVVNSRVQATGTTPCSLGDCVQSQNPSSRHTCDCS